MNRTLTRLSRLAADSALASDAGLLNAFVTGRDGAAFEALVRRHGPMVLAVCRRVLRHTQDTEDAFQATFLVLARRAGDVWPREAVGSWLYGVAYRVALKARTARARRLGRERPLGEAAPPVAEASQPSDFMDVLDRAIRKLPEVYRAAVVACDLEGRSRKEAAEQLGWKEGTLSGRLARARVLLAARLRRAGFTLPAGGVAAVLNTGSIADAVSPGLLGRVFSFAVVNAAAGVPPPVAALTEGVVRTMFVAKLKMAVVVILAAGAIGFGAWSSAGAGHGPETGTQPGAKAADPPPGAKAVPPPPAKAAPYPRLEVARHELDVLMEDIDVVARKKKATPADFERLKERVEAVWSVLTPGRELLQTPSNAPGMADELKRLQGKWQMVSMRDANRGVRKPEADDPRELVVEVRGNKIVFASLDAAGKLKHDEATIWRLDPSRIPKEIDLIGPRYIVERGIYDVRTEQGQATLVWSFGQGFRPAAFGNTPGGVFETTFRRVAEEKPAAPPADLNAVQAGLEQAKAQVALAEANLAEAKVKLELAQRRAAEAEKSTPKDKPGAPGRPACTLHVRTLTAPEKAIQIPAGQLTVLDALNKAGDAVPLIRGPEGLSVWVLREKAVLPVDLGAIVNRMQNTTNYQLRPGDQVFVQVKLGR